MNSYFYLFLFSLFVFTLFSCKQNEEITGYKPIGNGIYYKLLQFGESKEKPQPGDFVTAHISYLTGNDSVFFNAIRNVELAKSTYPGSVFECFFRLSEYDSASFIINADSFFNITLHSPLPSFIPASSKMKINIKLLAIKSAENYQKEKEEFLSWVEDLGLYEKTVLRHYIDNHNTELESSSDGIYRIDIKKGNGKQIERKDNITIHYIGRFLNGKIFDSTKDRNEPFQFVYGTEWQVVKGLEKALSGMCEGDHALFVMPSELAFGKDGSSTGIIPPYTSVIFEVEVISVESPETEPE